MPRWGHLDIGEGIGDSKAYNPMPLVQQYAQTLAENKATHDNEVKMLGDTLAKGYDPTGLRNDADKKAYINNHNSIKEDAIRYESEKDPVKRTLGLSEIRQRLANQAAYVDGSKKLGVFERQMALQHLNNPYLLDKNSATKLQSQLSKPWDDPSVIKDASGFERDVDPGKIDTMFEKHVGDVLKHDPVTYDNGVITKNPNTIDGKKLYTITKNRVVPFQTAYENTLNLATSNRDYQKFLDQKYPDIKTDDQQHTLALRVKQDMIARGYDKGFYDKPETKDYEGQAPQRWTKVQQWNLDKYGDPNGPKQGQANAPTYVQDLSSRIASPQTADQATDEINNMAVSNPAFAKGITVVQEPNGTKSIVIPPKYKYDAKKQEAYDTMVTSGETNENGEKYKPNPNAGRVLIQNEQKVNLDPNSKADHDQKVAMIYNELDPKNVSSKALTQGGKGHVVGGQHSAPAKPVKLTTGSLNNL